ncbi:MAG: YihY/virulence factor BrkB family protein [Chloroflexi bacterium]|nr:YihY/virulence factor BrkB family protein [Chloroflexota bacterium]
MAEVRLPWLAQHPRLMQFVQKLLDDRAPNLAVLVAWGALSTLFPAVLGLLALAGLILRDPHRLDQVSGALLAILPAPAAATLREVLASTRVNAGLAGVLSGLLVLFNGANFFAGVESVFNLVYHVPDRNLILQRVVGVFVLIGVVVLALVSTTAYSLSSVLAEQSSALLELVAIPLPGQNPIGAVVGWVVSLASIATMFLLLYRVLPHKRQSWREAVPGALVATVLLLLILQIFPLYLTLFGQGFEVYAVFGMFLVLMLWLFLLGLVLVLGVELNAFLEEPGRAAAVAQTTARAEVGQVEVERSSELIETRASGTGQPGRGDAEGNSGSSSDRA